MRPTAGFCLALSLAACAAADVATDDSLDEGAPDEPFLIGGRAVGGVADGTDPARAVLRAANLATAAELAGASAIGLQPRTAAAIIAYRNGPDGVPSTPDDRTFATLAELDAVPWVGKASFAHLLAWADAQGFAVPPACAATAARATTSQLVVTPDDGDATVLQLVTHATATLDVVMYELSSSDVIAALEGAAQRGVRVRVILDRQVAANPALVTKLTAAGVQAQLSSSQFTYTHEKTLVADRRAAFIFTGNFDRRSFGSARNYGAVDTAWQDIDDLAALFEGDWSGVAPVLTCTRLVVAPVNARGRVLDVIAAATRSLDVEALYVTDPDVEQALLDAHARGVAVRVLINDPAFGFGTAATGQALVAAGVEARRSGTLFIHAKVLVADGETVYLGSENFSRNSLLNNREIGAVFVPGELDRARIGPTFESDWARGISF